MPNPAFEGSGDSSTDTDDPTTNGDGDPGDSDPGDGDPGDGDPGDGDPGDGDGDEPLPDLPPDYCSVPSNHALEPTFGTPAQFDQGCPIEFYEALVKVYGTDEGDWMVGRCDGGCAYCSPNELLRVGAPSLSLELLLQAPPQNGEDPYIGCYLIEVEELVEEWEGGCIYSSLSLFPPQDNSRPVFAAMRDYWGLTLWADQLLLGWDPMILPDQNCLCADYDPNLLDNQCCDANLATSYIFDLNQGVVPGEGVPEAIMIDGTPYDFHGMQAQSGLSCELETEVSWAIVAPN